MHAHVLPVHARLIALASELSVPGVPSLLAHGDLYGAGEAFLASVPYAAHQRLRRDAAFACWALGDGRVEAALECLDLDADALLSADPDFVTVCDARRDGWIAAHDAEHADEPADAVDDEPRDGELVDCAACFGTGEGMLGGRCARCSGAGYSVYRTPADE